MDDFVEWPDEIQFIAILITGGKFPKMRAREVHAMGTLLMQGGVGLHAGVRALTHAPKPSVGGKPGEQLREFLGVLSHNAPALPEAAAVLGRASVDTARRVRYAQVMVISAAAALVIEIYFAHWNPITAAMIPSLILAARIWVMRLLGRLYTVMTAILRQMAYMIGIDVATQVIMMLRGDRTKWDWNTFAISAGMGAAAGLMLPAVASLTNKLLSNNLPLHPEIHSAFTEAKIEVLMTLFGAGVLHQPLSSSDFWQNAASGAFTGSITAEGRRGGRGGLNLSPDQTQELAKQLGALQNAKFGDPPAIGGPNGGGFTIGGPKDGAIAGGSHGGGTNEGAGPQAPPNGPPVLPPLPVFPELTVPELEPPVAPQLVPPVAPQLVPPVAPQLVPPVARLVPPVAPRVPPGEAPSPPPVAPPPVPLKFSSAEPGRPAPTPPVLPSGSTRQPPPVATPFAPPPAPDHVFLPGSAERPPPVATPFAPPPVAEHVVLHGPAEQPPPAAVVPPAESRVPDTRSVAPFETSGNGPVSTAGSGLPGLEGTGSPRGTVTQIDQTPAPPITSPAPQMHPAGPGIASPAHSGTGLVGLDDSSAQQVDPAGPVPPARSVASGPAPVSAAVPPPVSGSVRPATAGLPALEGVVSTSSSMSNGVSVPPPAGSTSVSPAPIGPGVNPPSDQAKMTSSDSLSRMDGQPSQMDGQGQQPPLVSTGPKVDAITGKAAVVHPQPTVADSTDRSQPSASASTLQPTGAGRRPPRGRQPASGKQAIVPPRFEGNGVVLRRIEDSVRLELADGETVTVRSGDEIRDRETGDLLAYRAVKVFAGSELLEAGTFVRTADGHWARVQVRPVTRDSMGVGVSRGDRPGQPTRAGAVDDLSASAAKGPVRDDVGTPVSTSEASTKHPIPEDELSDSADGSVPSPVRKDSSPEDVVARGTYLLAEYRKRVNDHMAEFVAKHPGVDTGRVPDEVLRQMMASDDEITRLAAASERIVQTEHFRPTVEQAATAEALLGALNDPRMRGSAVQHGTGEGKSIDVRLAAVLRAARDGDVLVLTSSEALVDRDFADMAEFVKPFDRFDVMVLDADTPLPPRAPGRWRIVFASKNRLLFHVLKMAEAGRFAKHGVPTGLPIHVIVDEVDAFRGAAYLSPGDEKTPPDQIASLRWANAVLEDGVLTSEDFGVGPDGHYQLTDSGRAKFDELRDRVAADRQQLPNDAELRLTRAAYSRWQRKKGDDFFIDVTNDGQRKVIIIDPETGEPLWDPKTSLEQQWNLDHQALAVQYGLDIPPLRKESKRTTVDEVFDAIRAAGGSVVGLSGTAKLAQSLLEKTIGTGVVEIPNHAASVREIVPTQIFSNESEKLDYATNKVLDQHEEDILSGGRLHVATDALHAQVRNGTAKPMGRPIMVIHHRNGLVAETGALLKQKMVERYGRERGEALFERNVMVVNAEQLFQWDKAGNRAATMNSIAIEFGHRGKILLINQVGGRGFDLKPANDTFAVDENGVRTGGARSWITSHALTILNDLQWLARVARGFYYDRKGVARGTPGQTQFLLSLDDPVITNNLSNLRLLAAVVDYLTARDGEDVSALHQAEQAIRELIPLLQDHAEFGTPVSGTITTKPPTAKHTPPPSPVANRTTPSQHSSPSASGVGTAPPARAEPAVKPVDVPTPPPTRPASPDIRPLALESGVGAPAPVHPDHSATDEELPPLAPPRLPTPPPARDVPPSRPLSAFDAAVAGFGGVVRTVGEPADWERKVEAARVASAQTAALLPVREWIEQAGTAVGMTEAEASLWWSRLDTPSATWSEVGEIEGQLARRLELLESGIDSPADTVAAIAPGPMRLPAGGMDTVFTLPGRGGYDTLFHSFRIAIAVGRALGHGKPESAEPKTSVLVVSGAVGESVETHTGPATVDDLIRMVGELPHPVDAVVFTDQAAGQAPATGESVASQLARRINGRVIVAGGDVDVTRELDLVSGVLDPNSATVDSVRTPGPANDTADTTVTPSPRVRTDDPTTGWHEYVGAQPARTIGNILGRPAPEDQVVADEESGDESGVAPRLVSGGRPADADRWYEVTGLPLEGVGRYQISEDGQLRLPGGVVIARGGWARFDRELVHQQQRLVLSLDDGVSATGAPRRSGQLRRAVDTEVGQWPSDGYDLSVSADALGVRLESPNRPDDADLLAWQMRPAQVIGSLGDEVSPEAAGPLSDAGTPAASGKGKQPAPPEEVEEVVVVSGLADVAGVARGSDSWGVAEELVRTWNHYPAVVGDEGVNAERVAAVSRVAEKYRGEGFAAATELAKQLGRDRGVPQPWVGLPGGVGGGLGAVGSSSGGVGSSSSGVDLGGLLLGVPLHLRGAVAGQLPSAVGGSGPPGLRPVTVVQGQIETSGVAAVVNAANAEMQDGAGVSGALYSRDRQGLAAAVQATRHRRELVDGLAAALSATTDRSDPLFGETDATYVGHLPAFNPPNGPTGTELIVHAVAPILAGGPRAASVEERVRLAAVVRNALYQAELWGMDSVIFPVLGAGVYGWREHEALAVMLQVLRNTPTTVSTIQVQRFVAGLGSGVHPIRDTDGWRVQVLDAAEQMINSWSEDARGGLLEIPATVATGWPRVPGDVASVAPDVGMPDVDPVPGQPQRKPDQQAPNRVGADMGTGLAGWGSVGGLTPVGVGVEEWVVAEEERVGSLAGVRVSGSADVSLGRKAAFLAAEAAKTLGQSKVRGSVREVKVGRDLAPPVEVRAADFEPDGVGYVMVVPVAAEASRSSADRSPVELARLYRAAMGTGLARMRMVIGVNQWNDPRRDVSTARWEAELAAEVERDQAAVEAEMGEAGRGLVTVIGHLMDLPVRDEPADGGTGRVVDGDVWRELRRQGYWLAGYRLNFPFAGVQQALVGSKTFWAYLQQLRASFGEVFVHFGDSDVVSLINPRGGNTRSVFDRFDEEIRRARAEQPPTRVVRLGGSITYSPQEIDSYRRGEEPGGEPSFVAKFNMVLVQANELWSQVLTRLGLAYYLEANTALNADLLGPLRTADGQIVDGLLAAMSQQTAQTLGGFDLGYGVHRRLTQLELNHPRWSRYLSDPPAQVVTSVRGEKRSFTEKDLAEVAQHDGQRWLPDDPGRTLLRLGNRPKASNYSFSPNRLLAKLGYLVGLGSTYDVSALFNPDTRANALLDLDEDTVQATRQMLLQYSRITAAVEALLRDGLTGSVEQLLARLADYQSEPQPQWYKDELGLTLSLAELTQALQELDLEEPAATTTTTATAAAATAAVIPPRRPTGQQPRRSTRLALRQLRSDNGKGKAVAPDDESHELGSSSDHLADSSAGSLYESTPEPASADPAHAIDPEATDSADAMDLDVEPDQTSDGAANESRNERDDSPAAGTGQNTRGLAGARTIGVPSTPVRPAEVGEKRRRGVDDTATHQRAKRIRLTVSGGADRGARSRGAIQAAVLTGIEPTRLQYAVLLELGWRVNPGSGRGRDVLFDALIGLSPHLVRAVLVNAGADPDTPVTADRLREAMASRLPELSAARPTQYGLVMGGATVEEIADRLRHAATGDAVVARVLPMMAAELFGVRVSVVDVDGVIVTLGPEDGPQIRVMRVADAAGEFAWLTGGQQPRLDRYAPAPATSTPARLPWAYRFGRAGLVVPQSTDWLRPALPGQRDLAAGLEIQVRQNRMQLTDRSPIKEFGAAGEGGSVYSIQVRDSAAEHTVLALLLPMMGLPGPSRLAAVIIEGRVREPNLADLVELAADFWPHPFAGLDVLPDADRQLLRWFEANAYLRGSDARATRQVIEGLIHLGKWLTEERPEVGGLVGLRQQVESLSVSELDDHVRDRGQVSQQRGLSAAVQSKDRSIVDHDLSALRAGHATPGRLVLPSDRQAIDLLKPTARRDYIGPLEELGVWSAEDPRRPGVDELARRMGRFEDDADVLNYLRAKGWLTPEGTVANEGLSTIPALTAVREERAIAVLDFHPDLGASSRRDYKSVLRRLSTWLIGNNRPGLAVLGRVAGPAKRNRHVRKFLEDHGWGISHSSAKLLSNAVNALRRVHAMQGTLLVDASDDWSPVARDVSEPGAGYLEQRLGPAESVDGGLRSGRPGRHLPASDDMSIVDGSDDDLGSMNLDAVPAPARRPRRSRAPVRTGAGGGKRGGRGGAAKSAGGAKRVRFVVSAGPHGGTSGPVEPGAPSTHYMTTRSQFEALRRVSWRFDLATRWDEDAFFDALITNVPRQVRAVLDAGTGPDTPLSVDRVREVMAELLPKLHATSPVLYGLVMGAATVEEIGARLRYPVDGDTVLSRVLPLLAAELFGVRVSVVDLDGAIMTLGPEQGPQIKLMRVASPAGHLVSLTDGQQPRWSPHAPVPTPAVGGWVDALPMGLLPGLIHAGVTVTAAMMHREVYDRAHPDGQREADDYLTRLAGYRPGDFDDRANLEVLSQWLASRVLLQAVGGLLSSSGLDQAMTSAGQGMQAAWDVLPDWVDGQHLLGPDVSAQIGLLVDNARMWAGVDAINNLVWELGEHPAVRQVQEAIARGDRAQLADIQDAALAGVEPAQLAQLAELADTLREAITAQHLVQARTNAAARVETAAGIVRHALQQAPPQLTGPASVPAARTGAGGAVLAESTAWLHTALEESPGLAAWIETKLLEDQVQRTDRSAVEVFGAPGEDGSVYSVQVRDGAARRTVWVLLVPRRGAPDGPRRLAAVSVGNTVKKPSLEHLVAYARSHKVALHESAIPRDLSVEDQEELRWFDANALLRGSVETSVLAGLKELINLARWLAEPRSEGFAHGLAGLRRRDGDARGYPEVKAYQDAGRRGANKIAGWVNALRAGYVRHRYAKWDSLPVADRHALNGLDAVYQKETLSGYKSALADLAVWLVANKRPGLAVLARRDGPAAADPDVQDYAVSTGHATGKLFPALDGLRWVFAPPLEDAATDLGDASQTEVPNAGPVTLLPASGHWLHNAPAVAAQMAADIASMLRRGEVRPTSLPAEVAFGPVGEGGTAYEITVGVGRTVWALLVPMVDGPARLAAVSIDGVVHEPSPDDVLGLAEAHGFEPDELLRIAELSPADQAQLRWFEANARLRGSDPDAVTAAMTMYIDFGLWLQEHALDPQWPSRPAGLSVLRRAGPDVRDFPELAAYLEGKPASGGENALDWNAFRRGYLKPQTGDAPADVIQQKRLRRIRSGPPPRQVVLPTEERTAISLVNSLGVVERVKRAYVRKLEDLSLWLAELTPERAVELGLPNEKPPGVAEIIRRTGRAEHDPYVRAFLQAKSMLTPKGTVTATGQNVTAPINGLRPERARPEQEREAIEAVSDPRKQRALRRLSDWLFIHGYEGGVAAIARDALPARDHPHVFDFLDGIGHVAPGRAFLPAAWETLSAVTAVQREYGGGTGQGVGGHTERGSGPALPGEGGTRFVQQARHRLALLPSDAQMDTLVQLGLLPVPIRRSDGGSLFEALTYAGAEHIEEAINAFLDDAAVPQVRKSGLFGLTAEYVRSPEGVRLVRRALSRMFLHDYEHNRSEYDFLWMPDGPAAMAADPDPEAFAEAIAIGLSIAGYTDRLLRVAARVFGIQPRVVNPDGDVTASGNVPDPDAVYLVYVQPRPGAEHYVATRTLASAGTFVKLGSGIDVASNVLIGIDNNLLPLGGQIGMVPESQRDGLRVMRERLDLLVKFARNDPFAGDGTTAPEVLAAAAAADPDAVNRFLLKIAAVEAAWAELLAAINDDMSAMDPSDAAPALMGATGEMDVELLSTGLGSDGAVALSATTDVRLSPPPLGSRAAGKRPALSVGDAVVSAESGLGGVAGAGLGVGRGSEAWGVAEDLVRTWNHYPAVVGDEGVNAERVAAVSRVAERYRGRVSRRRRSWLSSWVVIVVCRSRGWGCRVVWVVGWVLWVRRRVGWVRRRRGLIWVVCCWGCRFICVGRWRVSCRRRWGGRVRLGCAR